MDLYRMLRVANYLVAFAGVFALSVAEGSFVYLFLVGACAMAAILTVDAGRMKPVNRRVLAGVLAALVALFVSRWYAGERRDAMTLSLELCHFLCVYQGVMFFGPHRDQVIQYWTGLVLVIVSGRLDDGPTMLVRLIVFLLTCAWAMLMQAMYRERVSYERASEMAAESPADGRAAAKLRAGYFRQGVWYCAMVAACAMLLGFTFFFAAPRVAGDVSSIFRAWPSAKGGANGAGKGPGSRSRPEPWGDPEYTTGLANRVSLRHLGELKTDNSKALALKLSGRGKDLVRSDSLYLRGEAFLDYVDGYWEHPVRSATARMQAGAGGWIQVTERPPREDLVPVTQSVEMLLQQGGIGYFLCLAPVSRIRWEEVYRDGNGALWCVKDRALSFGDRYEIESFVSPDPIANPVGMDPGSPPQGTELERATKADALSPAACAVVLRQIREAGARTPEQKVAALLALFRDSGRYRYTLDLKEASSVPGDPVSAFIADENRRAGHCGFFASAFALSCRSVQVPARMVSGFAGGEYDAEGDKFILRNSNAHAWVEVFLTGRGWVLCDPTPSGGRPGDPVAAPTERPRPPGAPTTRVSLVGERPIEREGAMKRAWSYFLSYDADAQSELFENIRRGVASALSRSGRGWSGTESQSQWIYVALALGVAGGILALLLLQRRRRRNDPLQRVPPQRRAAFRFYNDLLSLLARRGLVRRPCQTPGEFAEAVRRRAGEVSDPVREITQVFEQVRYGGVDLTPDDENRLQAAFERITKAFEEKAAAAAE